MTLLFKISTPKLRMKLKVPVPKPIPKFKITTMIANFTKTINTIENILLFQQTMLEKDSPISKRFNFQRYLNKNPPPNLGKGVNTLSS